MDIIREVGYIGGFLNTVEVMFPDRHAMGCGASKLPIIMTSMY
jgi:hypothetical protein